MPGSREVREEVGGRGDFPVLPCRVHQEREPARPSCLLGGFALALSFSQASDSTWARGTLHCLGSLFSLCCQQHPSTKRHTRNSLFVKKKKKKKILLFPVWLSAARKQSSQRRNFLKKCYIIQRWVNLSLASSAL